MTSAVADPVGTPTRRRRSKLALRNTLLGWSFILPNFLGFAIITLVPVVTLFYIALTDFNVFGKGDFIGVGNFVKLVSDPLFQRSLLNTFYYSAMHVPLTIVVSLVVYQTLPSVFGTIAIVLALLGSTLMVYSDERRGEALLTATPPARKTPEGANVAG